MEQQDDFSVPGSEIDFVFFFKAARQPVDIYAALLHDRSQSTSQPTTPAGVGTADPLLQPTDRSCPAQHLRVSKSKLGRQLSRATGIKWLPRQTPLSPSFSPGSDGRAKNGLENTPSNPSAITMRAMHVLPKSNQEPTNIKAWQQGQCCEDRKRSRTPPPTTTSPHVGRIIKSLPYHQIRDNHEDLKE